jgi:hypothetical protein
MRVYQKSRASLLAVATLAVVGLPASADELLVLPFRCTVVGGQTVLTPSPDQGHRIVGPREQRTFRSCSQMNPALCLQWPVHRFDLDCGGARVSWASVVASAQASRAWLDNGRLHVRVPQRWSMAADDPCAGGPDYGDRWRFGRLGRYCAERRALAPPSSVEMPAGFAPMLGIDAIFVAATPSPGGTPQRLGPAPPPSSAPAAIPPPPKIARAEPALPPEVRDPSPREKPSSKAPASGPDPQRPPALAHPPVPAQPPATSNAPVIPKIINRPDPTPAEIVPMAPPPAVLPKTTPSNLDTPAAPPAYLEPDKTTTPVASTENSVPVTLVTVLSTPATAIAAMASTIILAIAAFALMRGREKANPGGMPRDIASISLDGSRQDRQLVVQQRALARGIPQLPAGAAQPETPLSAVYPAWGDTIPSTRADALQVLGMGVTPDVSLAAIKKIVDGLRQTWHPDLGRDPSERGLREQRLKQINAAWEILAGKRVQA